MRTDFTMAHYGDWQTPAVLAAQRLLNNNLDPSDSAPPLVEDGKFGDKTYKAVKKFQERVFGKGRDVDGIVGPKTFAALGLQTLVSWPVRLRAQKTGGRCWAAAASMILGGLEPSPGLANVNARGALVDTDENVKLFAASLRWEVLSAKTKDFELLAKLKTAPLWVGGDSVNARGNRDSIHAVVLAGMFTYEWAGDSWLLLKIYDPFPNGRGRIIFMQYEAPKLPGGNTFSVRWFLAPPSWVP